MLRKINSVGLLIVFLVIIIVGSHFLVRQFFKSLAPPKVTITKLYISTDRDFINGVSIEKIHVDSIGEKGYPVKYTTYYRTKCNIKHPSDRPPEPPDKIEFSKPGKYTWDEDTSIIRYVHSGLSRESSDSSNRLWWLKKFNKHPVCPISFEKQQWYYFQIGDPSITGIFFYINGSGKEDTYVLKSGVSPI